MIVHKRLTALLLGVFVLSTYLPVAASVLPIQDRTSEKIAQSASTISNATPLPTAVPPSRTTPVSTAEPPEGYPIATAEPTPDPTWFSDLAYLDDRSTATGLVKSYFNAINRKEYLRAYSYWRTPAASLGQYEKFAAGFKQTASVKVRLGQVSEGIAAGQIYYSVPVLIRALTTTGEHQRFTSCFVLQLSQPAAQGIPPFIPMGIDHAKTRVVTTIGHGGALLASACGGSDKIGVPIIPSPQTNREDTSAKNYLDDRSDPVQVLRSLVNAINRKEYVRAYSYWEHVEGLANVPPFDQFAKGYAGTESVRLITGVVQRDAGAGQFRYSVPVVLIARTTRGITQVFAGCYTLHISNPAVQAKPPFMPLSIHSADVHQYENAADYNVLLVGACKP